MSPFSLLQRSERYARTFHVHTVLTEKAQEHSFEALVDSALLNLRVYLVENARNPYESYVFGDYWLETLNR